MISRYVQDWVHKIPIDTIASQLGEVADNFSGGNEIDEAADPQLYEEPAEASNDRSQPGSLRTRTPLSRAARWLSRPNEK